MSATGAHGQHFELDVVNSTRNYKVSTELVLLTPTLQEAMRASVLRESPLRQWGAHYLKEKGSKVYVLGQEYTPGRHVTFRANKSSYHGTIVGSIYW